MSIWTDEMKSAAMKDAQRVCDLDAAARFLVARLREYEPVCQCEDAVREWNGHVSPALARMEALLNKPQF
jgi:hypothetical protein